LRKIFLKLYFSNTFKNISKFSHLMSLMLTKAKKWDLIQWRNQKKFSKTILNFYYFYFDRV
jgi:hypothetical protein